MTMNISLIAAMSENGVIGRNNKMPWNLPSDRARFHAITQEHPIILGRKTFESIGRPLSHRTNIVLTRQRDYCAEEAIVVHDLDSAFAACAGADEVFICGGEEVFRETIGLADKIYLTVIHRVVGGDAYFPVIPGNFVEVERQEVEDVMPYALVRYERRKDQASASVR
ncbi:MAG TPA: dihydrofolate reductase [Nitrospirota bacterium]